MLSTLSKTDVLAISYVNDFICLGLGSYLHVVNKFNYKFIAKLNVLYPQRIHGIKKTPENELIIFGGKSLRICKLDIIDKQVKIHSVSDIHQFTDWIIDAECVSLKNEKKLSILFAHNNLYICDLLNKQQHTVWCEEKCILYGGSIFQNDHENVVVFSGTVFQEILIWQGNTSTSNDAKILHRLKGHNGVIFSVRYDPITNIICSTSDDRTVRLWSICEKSQITPTRNYVEWNKVVVNLKATMYGHTARVWRAIIKNNIIISIGEDSQICLWSKNGQFLKKIQAHNGSPIWCMDVSTEDKKMITGAADGSVYVWPFPFTNDPEKDLLIGQEINKTPKFTSYFSGGIIVIRDDGEINYFHPITHNLITSSIIPKFTSYISIQVSPDKNRVGLGSKDGLITIYERVNEELKCQITEKIMDSKIFSMHWLNDQTLLICGSLGRLNIVRIASDGKLEKSSEYILPESRERWITSAILHKNLLICGDRSGNVFVFKIFAKEGEDSQKPVQIFHKIHGKLGIQDCLIKNNKLITAGRDGHLRFYEIRNENGEYILELENAKNMPMDWISRILETKDDLYTFGFSEVDFIIYSVSLRRILIRIPCGGGHRSWDCVIDKNILKFLFIKDKRVHLQVFPFQKLALLPLIEGFHSKEIYCLRKLKTLENSFIFISGGEDCSLRISQGFKSKATKEIEDFKTLEILDGHISSIKCLAVLNIENTEFYSKNLIFSGGGRAQLKAWRLNIKSGKKELTNEDLNCKSLDSFMLRGTDKERKKLSKSTKITYDVDPETRFMDISVHSCLDVSNLIFLFVACSDGYFRIFSWNTDESKFKLENSLQCERCILKVYSFLHKNNLIVLTMATDGIVNFWNFNYLLSNIARKEYNGTISPFTKLQIHQSGINSFDLKKMSSDEYLLATGGDDNLLSLIFIKIIVAENGNLLATVITKCSSSDSHYTQITGVQFLEENKLCSVGTDQKVIIHQYLLKNQELSLIKEKEFVTCVSDVQGAILCESNEDETAIMCTYGKGFEFISER